MSGWHLAQMNVGRARFVLDDPRMAGFMDNLDAVNTLADACPGFVWRLQSDAGNATDILLTDDPQFIINMSVWETPDALFDFVYKTAHRDIMVQRRDWFEKPTEAYMALWWTEAGSVPTAEEGLSRLDRLRRNGPGPDAFTFKNLFIPAGEDDSTDIRPEPYCVGWR